MSQKLTKLLSISSPALSASPTAKALSALCDDNSSPLLKELCTLLAAKNGFFSFESSLLVRPLENEQSPLGIMQWNDSQVWKKEYKIDIAGSISFGEDIFGTQFCVKDKAVQSFDPETGRFTKIADSLETWAEWIMEKPELRTGWPLAHAWQTRHGALPPGMRLLPKVPFVCDGAFAVENMYLLNDVKGMCFRASIANQLIDVPDGSQVILKIDKHGGHGDAPHIINSE